MLAVILVPTSKRLQAQEAEATTQPAVAAQEISPELLRSFLHLQEQVHITQMAVERGRLEAEAAAARNTEALNARLALIETTLDRAQENSTAAMQEASRQIRESNRQMMIFAGVFASIGFLALALTGWLQWKTASRLSLLPSQVGFPAMLPPQAYESLGLGQSAQRPNVRLMDALGRLEHRISDLEVGHQEPAASADTPEHPPSKAAPSSRTALTALIREGEALLAREEAEKAIEHFDSVLEKHPGHPEVLLHKGAALERLQRHEEAIACYDQAIRADKNLTMAYLHKGGLYNRMERFSEAMECYEQALRVQEGRTVIS